MSCAKCDCQIHYGDDFITDVDTDDVYCCADCFMESRGVRFHGSSDSSYESYFKRVKHEEG